MNSQRHNNHTAAGTAIRRGATPGSGPSCESGRARRTGSIRIFQSPTFFGTMAAIALVVPLLVTSSVFADGPTTGTDYYWHLDGGCNSQYKISHKASDCLGAWWDNTPHHSSGYIFGSTFGARNFCVNYGYIKAHIDRLNSGDQHFHLDHGEKQKGHSARYDISGISCCIDKSQLCYKAQVEKDPDGKIKVWKGTGTQFRMKSVDTHRKRFDFCKKYRYNVYCKVNPEGDAFTAPLAYNCGDHYCTADDCDAEYEKSDVRDPDTVWEGYGCHPSTLTNGYSSSISSTDGASQHCTIDTACRKKEFYTPDGGGLAGRWIDNPTSITADIEDIDDLHNCDGELTVGSC